MLPPEYRIRKKKEFEEVFQRGRSVKGSFYFIKVKRNSFFFPRFAFVVPAKFEKKASKRNRIKRVFREAVRSLLPLIKEGSDMIFVIRGQENIKLTRVKEEIKELLEKQKLI